MLDNNEVCVICYSESQERMPFCLNCGARILSFDLPAEESALAALVEPLRSAWLNSAKVDSIQQIIAKVLDELDHKMSSAPRDGKLWVSKGNVLVLVEQMDNAAVCYDRALVFDSKLAAAWVGKSTIALSAMQYNDAVKFADQALSIDPESSLSLVCKGYGLLCLGRLGDALEITDQALSAATRQTEAISDLQARATLVRSMRVGFACKVKAHLLTARGEHDGALKAFDQALALNSGDKGAANNKTALLAFLGRYDEMQQSRAPSASALNQINAGSVQPAQPMSEVFSGNGQQVSAPFNLSSGLARFQLNHFGHRHFGVWLLDGAGNRVALLANQVGSFNGSKAVGIRRSGVYLLNIDADGSWNIQVQQP